MASPTFMASPVFPERGLRLRDDCLDATFDRITPGPTRGAELAGFPGGTLLPAGWCRLATGLRDTRLYRVSLPGQAAIYWEAAMKLGGKLLHRRFAGELHARAWLSATTEPREMGIPIDLEEIHGPIRTAGVKGGSRVPF